MRGIALIRRGGRATVNCQQARNLTHTLAAAMRAGMRVESLAGHCASLPTRRLRFFLRNHAIAPTAASATPQVASMRN
jgi:hypothetical protein